MMTPNPTTVTQKPLISPAVTLMLEQRISCLPVVDEHNRLVGLLSLVTWSLSTGNAKLIATGSATVGGREAWISSEFSNAFIFAVSFMTFYTFFLVCTAFSQN